MKGRSAAPRSTFTPSLTEIVPLPSTSQRAAVQLLPDPAIPTDEQGTRHRTADRVSKQTGFPVVSVSTHISRKLQPGL